ncbi:MAG: inositol-3-phosphate synthase [Syntrophales bacterium]|nr:inositol-3-phosphate synthase [Syntrophales bacterium]
MAEIRIGIVGVGNCASSLIQGIHYYADKKDAIGLMHYSIGGYEPGDIKVVAAFDIDARKVNKPLHEAVFVLPNCTKRLVQSLPDLGVKVMMGPVFDGIAPHMHDYPPHRTFIVAEEKPVDVVEVLKNSGVEILINYLPVGSEEATRFYANCCLEAGVSFINCIPVFIASDDLWAKRFKEKNIPLIGDDVKSQIGATVLHRTLVRLFRERGVKLNRTYQLNTGGNTDFLNMMNHQRIKWKRISKTDAVQSQLEVPLPDEDIHIGPSDYVPWQFDNKVCFIRMEGRIFGDVPVELELRLSVEDSPNSAGCVIDAIRCCKLARERGIGGVLESVSAFTMKRPPKQYTDSVARVMMEEFIAGRRDI